MRYPERISIGTIKDSPEFRLALEKKSQSKIWQVVYFKHTEAWAVWPEHWDRVASQFSEREYQRRVLCEMPPPEDQLFYCFSREIHIGPVPRKWENVTEIVAGRGFRVVVGYDPGTAQHVALFLEAYAPRDSDAYGWWVRREMTEKNVTAKQMARLAHKVLIAEFETDIPKRRSARALVFSDKWVNTEVDDRHPDRTVYTAWRNQGLEIRPAVFGSQKPRRSGPAPELRPGSVPFYASVEMINGLLLNSKGETKLQIDIDTEGNPVAPLLVRALEQSKRDQAHVKPKDKRKDLSDHPAALRLGLWPIEHERFELAA